MLKRKLSMNEKKKSVVALNLSMNSPSELKKSFIQIEKNISGSPSNKQTDVKEREKKRHWLIKRIIRNLHDKRMLNGCLMSRKNHIEGGNNFDARPRPFAVSTC